MLRSSLLVRKTFFCIEPSAFICMNNWQKLGKYTNGFEKSKILLET